MNDGRFETILKTILNGDLSKKEIERRLQEVIDEELSGPLDAPADMELVEKCQSLLWELATNGSIPYPDHAEESKQKLVQKLEQPSFGRRTSFLRRLFVVAAAFVLVCGLSLISIRWIRKSSSPDGQQYVIQGNEINIDVITNCIAERLGNTELITDDYSQLVGYLGFDPKLPTKLMNIYQRTTSYAYVLPDWIECDTKYVWGDKNIYVIVYYLVNPEDCTLFLEQNEEGTTISLSNIDIYASENINKRTLTWSKDFYVFCVSGEFAEDNDKQIVYELMEGLE